MKIVTLYEIRQFGIKGSCYSRTVLNGKLFDKASADKLVSRRLAKGQDVTASPVKVRA